MKMKTVPNINTFGLLQEQKPMMQKKESHLMVSKNALIHLEDESAQQAMNLKQILQSEQFIHSEWDGQNFPGVFVAMTPYMMNKFEKYQKACYFYLWPAGIQSENGTRDIGLLLTLNSNLEPSVLVILIFTGNEIKPDEAFFRLLQFVNSRSQIGNIVIYCNLPQLISQAVENFNKKQNKNIQLQPSFLLKEIKLKEILINYKILKKPYLKKQAFQIISLMLQEKDEKKFDKYLQKFKEWNLQGYNKFTKQSKDFKLIFQLPQTFYGFSLFKKYDNSIQAWMRSLQKQKFKNEADFINKIIKSQYEQMQLKRAPCVDQCSVFQINSRVKQLQNFIQPNPLTEFIQNYSKSLSFKQNKINSSKYIIGGKTGSAFQVTKLQGNQWTCQCGQTIRLGIPCQHLLKICSLEKLSFQAQISPIYRKGHQKPFLHVD